MFKAAKILFLYGETPLHVGSGSSLGTVDLPIQRERHTDLPTIQSSGIKGKLRSAFKNNGLPSTEVFTAIFGPDSNNASDHAGALSPGDGRLLLFPVRSLAGVFAWITCPLVLSRLQRDLAISEQSQTWQIPQPNNDRVATTNNCQLIIDGSVILEEFSFSAIASDGVTALAKWLADNALPVGNEYDFWRDKLKKDLVIVSDDVFKDFCKFSTDIVSRTKLDPITKIVETGALWTEENLPADTLLYTPLFVCDPRIDKENRPQEVKDATAILSLLESQFTDNHKRLQLGGNETVGRGIVATRMI
ncbi:type III-B CRISPR module RAMP protein Cmr4 [Pleurocapsales cyanobacterium LEGE 06147]|nr:type III-B CRISPR module RAMP protein Cmr4 [Pleurocapsales cyanobacterium LEGE 06147]